MKDAFISPSLRGPGKAVEGDFRQATEHGFLTPDALHPSSSLLL